MALTDKQVQHKCLYASGSATCRYLEQDRFDWRKFNCVKTLSKKKSAIDKAVRKYLKECSQKKRDPSLGWTSIGDGGNCPGYPYLTTVKQGYDVQKP